MIRTLTLTLTALPGAYVAACRGTVKDPGAPQKDSSAAMSRSAPATSSSSRMPGESRDADNDGDNPSNSRYDKDDAEILAYGHAPRAASAQRVATLVKRYLAMAAAGDGVAGCSAMYSLSSESIVEEAGQAPAPPSQHGTTCPEVMSKLFKQDHRQLAVEAKLGVTGVRISGNRGYALLGHGALTRGLLLLHREAGSWKVNAVIPSRLP